MATNDQIWKVCDHFSRQEKKHCTGCIEEADGTVRKCRLRAEELINIVQTGNAWAKSVGPRMTEINGKEEKTCRGCPDMRQLQGVKYCRYLGNHDVVDHNVDNGGLRLLIDNRSICDLSPVTE